MLPGFRFLVAAILCSISLTVFGMGAAALLRAAHEQFASNSSWRSTQASGFTTFLPPAEPPPVLAVLRVEPSPAAPLASAASPIDAPQAAAEPLSAAASDAPVTEKIETAAAVEPPALPTPSLPADLVDTSRVVIPSQTVAALSDGTGSMKPEIGSADMASTVVVEKATDKPKMDMAPEATASNPAPVVASSTSEPLATPTAPASGLQVVASADTAIATPALPAPAPAPVALDPIAAKLAALGEQPIHQERPAAGEHRASVKIASVQLRRSVLKKRQAREKQLAAKRAKQRRYAQRVRAARQAAAQQQQPQAFPNPFEQQPFGQAQGMTQAAAPRSR
ncbi:hypothetical protein ACQR0Z_06945 [Bradyrhizobium sp. HKCCYLS3077]|uniref:hypothetical protein n=1 Tax=Bradyrhizobium sp. HKCCYLS3077 TaxID=3420761 RepID=UPI003EB6FD4D